MYKSSKAKLVLLFMVSVTSSWSQEHTMLWLKFFWKMYFKHKQRFEKSLFVYLHADNGWRRGRECVFHLPRAKKEKLFWTERTFLKPAFLKRYQLHGESVFTNESELQRNIFCNKVQEIYGCRLILCQNLKSFLITVYFFALYYI